MYQPKLLKSVRASKLLTQSQVAEKMGVTRITYHRKEKGETSFSTDDITKLVNILNIDSKLVCEIWGFLRKEK